MYLTYEQLDDCIRHVRSLLSANQLREFNNNKKLARMSKSMELPKRILLLIKENSIPKLHELVKVAMNNKRGIQYIISKMIDAIDGIYSAQSNSDDKEIAMLYQFGGPGLLDILHRSLNLPSTSTISKMARKGKVIDSSINTPIDKFVENFEFNTACPKYGCMLKIDETYTDAKVRWNPRDNRI